MIIKCEECNHDVSDKAVACPHCGAPVTTAPVKGYDHISQYDPEADYATVKAPGEKGGSGGVFWASFMLAAIAASLWAWFGDGTAGFGNQSLVNGFYNAAQVEFPGREGMIWTVAWMGCAMIAIPAGIVAGFIGTLFASK